MNEVRNLAFEVGLKNLKHTLLMLWSHEIISGELFLKSIRELGEAQTRDDLKRISDSLETIVKKYRTDLLKE